MTCSLVGGKLVLSPSHLVVPQVFSSVPILVECSPPSLSTVYPVYPLTDAPVSSQ